MKKFVVTLIILIFAASFAYAGTCNMCANLKSSDQAKVCGARILSGLSNTALGWTEIFSKPGKEVAAGGNIVVGLFKGLGNAITRTVVGAVEVATFWTPGDTVCGLPDCPLCACCASAK